MLKIKPLYLIAIVIAAAFATWKLTLMSRYQSASITLLTVKRLDSSLTVANEIMRRSNAQIIAVFDQKLRDPITVEKAKIWSPIVNAAIEQTNRIVHQIEAIKTQLKKEAGLEIFEGKEKYHEDDIDAATRLMLNQGKGQILIDSMKTFSQSLLAILPGRLQGKLPQLPLTALLNEPIDGFFKKTPAIAAIALLSKFQNEVLQSGNIVADFCSNQVTTYSDNFLEKFETLVSQNTTTLLAGETLEIKVGLGAFSTTSKPTITIDGEPQIINENGIAEYKIKVGNTNGKVPVCISYTDPNTGQITTRNKQVSYTITKQ